MVPIRIALEEENPPVQLGLSVLVGIRKVSEKPDAAWISQTRSTATNAAISKL